MKDDSSCPSPRIIIAAWGGDANLRRFVERHVTSCMHCSAIVAALHELSDFVGSGGDIYNEIAQAIDERLSAEKPHRWQWLAGSEPIFHHRIVIAHLIERSDECYPSKPGDGLCYADASIAAFEAMTSRRQPAIAADALLYATGLKNRATHLYLLGRYSAALCAADASAAVVAPFGIAEGTAAHLGAVALARAVIYGDVDVCEYSKALSEIAEAERLFAYGSPDRISDARAMRAIVFVRSGRFEHARALLLEMLPSAAPGSSDRGRLLQYLAWCALAQSDAPDALSYAAEALQIHTVHQNRVDRARAEWAIGRARSLKGERQEARTYFDRASEVFSESEQLDLWVRVRLDYIHDVLADEPNADVRVMCESIATVSQSLDRRESLRRHHCTAEALAYLRRSAAANALTAETVGYVIAYLDRLTTAPPVRFMPPPPTFVM